MHELEGRIKKLIATKCGGDKAPERLRRPAGMRCAKRYGHVLRRCGDRESNALRSYADEGLLRASRRHCYLAGVELPLIRPVVDDVIARADGR